MLRPVSLLPALVVVATLLGAPTAPATADAPRARAAPADPLAVSIDSLSSSEIPQKGPVVVTGSVTNQDDGTWRTINVYPFVGSTPITTSAELAEAAATPPTTEVGERIIDLSDPRTEYTIDELAPGDTAQFTVTVPHRYLAKTEGGVYWFGVHALGDGPEGRVEGADGRARTFLPYVPPTGKTVDTALVVPVRHLVTHAPDGSIGDLDEWTDQLSPGGSLDSLVDLGSAAGTRPMTWLVDQSVVDAARRLAADNPGRSLGPTVTKDGQDGGDAESLPASPAPADGDENQADEPTPNERAAADAATSWLEQLHAGLDSGEILSLPYGDIDVAAAAQHQQQVYRQARRRSSGPLQPWGLPTTPAVSSPAGYLDAQGIRMIERRTTLLLTDRMFGPDAPSVVTTAGHTVGVTSSGGVAGGPGPDDPRAPLAMRQRLVSEAAIRLLSAGRNPLIAVLPTNWSPDAVADFWTGFDLDWLNLTTVADAMRHKRTDVPVDELRYPESQARFELESSSFAAADDLVRAGDTLQNLLTQNDEVGSEVRDEAWTDLSYWSRQRPDSARASADQSRTWIETRLRSVTIDAPKAVILSSGSGRFAATVTNGLDEPVSVKIRAVSDPPLRVVGPTEAIELAPDRSTTVLLNASSGAIGIRNATLLLTDADDAPLGSFDDVPIRSNRVSNVIWLIIGTGIALLFGAIVVRLVRRVRAARRP